MTEPVYASTQTSAAILERMREAYEALYPGQDTRRGSVAHAMLAPAAEELAAASMIAELAITRMFVATAPRDALLQHGDQHGISVKPAIPAVGFVQVTGVPGSVLTAGSLLSTEAPSGTKPQIFSTDAEATLDVNGFSTVPVTALVAGAAGNVPANSIRVLLTFHSNVTSVTNLLATTEGDDEEATETYRARILFRLRNPASSGNMADHISWAMEVPGVGAASVIPVEDGPGTVNVYLVNSAGLAASQVLVDQVQLAVAPPWVSSDEAESLGVVTAGGVSQIARTDASGGLAVQMVYVGGSVNGLIRHLGLQDILPRAGVWELIVTALVLNSAQALVSFRAGIWNATTGAWTAARVDGTGQGMVSLTAADMGPSFQAYRVPFYWNGTDVIRTDLIKVNVDDVNAIVVVDNVVYRSTFSKDDGSGKAPIGQRVTYFPAEEVDIDVSVKINPVRGFTTAQANQAASDAVAAYVKERALTLGDKTIRYGEVARAIMLASSVNNYDELLVNGAVANVVIGPREVPVYAGGNFETWNEFDAHGRVWNEFDALTRTWRTFSVEA
jgi:uncharacterized phage protein gp47/JayE